MSGEVFVDVLISYPRWHQTRVYSPLACRVQFPTIQNACCPQTVDDDTPVALFGTTYPHFSTSEGCCQPLLQAWCRFQFRPWPAEGLLHVIRLLESFNQSQEVSPTLELSRGTDAGQPSGVGEIPLPTRTAPLRQELPLLSWLCYHALSTCHVPQPLFLVLLSAGMVLAGVP